MLSTLYTGCVTPFSDHVAKRTIYRLSVENSIWFCLISKDVAKMERKNRHLFQSLFVVASRIIYTVWVQFSPNGNVETTKRMVSLQKEQDQFVLNVNIFF